MTDHQNACAEIGSLIRAKKSDLLSKWRQLVRRLDAGRALDRPTLNDHIPDFLDELSWAFESAADDIALHKLSNGFPPEHGIQRYRNGFELRDVIAEYNMLRECIHDLVVQHGISLEGRPFRIINRALDEAIGSAASTFAEHQAFDEQQRREDYLAFVAHDLRTPLNALTLASEILQKLPHSYTDGQAAERAFTTLHRNVGYLQTLVNKVLEENTSVQTEIGIKVVRRWFDLWPLVASLEQDLSSMAATAGTKIINDVHEDIRAFADVALVRRVLQNLIGNALQHAPGGEIVISALQTEDGAVVCEVADNGIGITEDRLSLIFEKFETDGVMKRTKGLGLTICKAFIEAHGGHICVKSDVGIGSVFSFALPGD
ncbi:ATP-binding protein [Herbaspirillum sp. GCM10030257]|uniref:ATP-binding protein n=1 Tax=Herbaspirillum sp. GCM10030257 TaxID=3273393 RepID=UPI00360A8D53